MVTVRSSRNRQVNRGRIGLQLRNHRLNMIGRVDDIGIRLAKDAESDRRLTVPSPVVTDVLGRIRHFAEVGDADRCPVYVRYDQRLVILGLEKLVGGAELPGVRGPAISPLGRLALAPARVAAIWSMPMLYLLTASGIQLYAHRRQRAAVHLHLSDSMNLGRFSGPESRRRVVHGRLGCGVGSEREDEDRKFRRVGFAPNGLEGRFEGR